VALVMLMHASAVHSQVWRCESAGKVVYTDAACEKGRRLDAAALSANVMPREQAPAQVAARPVHDQVRPPAAGAHTPEPAGNASVCPSELEIRNWEVSANARTISDEVRDLLRDEVRRARQCHKGQGFYTAKDWDISRSAQNDARGLRGPAQARELADSMHSAADPIEGDRIAARKARERQKPWARVEHGSRAGCRVGGSIAPCP
jgi:hypothetical protein